jgi:hypothetical protein
LIKIVSLTQSLENVHLSAKAMRNGSIPRPGSSPVWASWWRPSPASISAGVRG